MNPAHPQRKLDRDDQETVERRAATSNEFPTNVTRSTQDLTTGGSEKDPDSHAQASADREHPECSPAEMHISESSSKPTEAPTEGLSSSEQAAVNQERALESGEESPG
jgi:hypothetical protein